MVNGIYTCAMLDKEISYHNTIAAPQRELCFGHNDFK